MGNSSATPSRHALIMSLNWRERNNRQAANVPHPKGEPPSVRDMTWIIHTFAVKWAMNHVLGRL